MLAVQVKDGASFLKLRFLIPISVTHGVIAYEACHQVGEHPDFHISQLRAQSIKAKPAVLKITVD